MTNQTKIEWCDFTVNFWEGCQKVGPGCDHCYAEARDQRFTGGQHWGPHAPRRKVKGGLQKLLNIQAKAQPFRVEHGHWPRVFCSSLSDVFDNAVDRSWQYEAFSVINACPDTRVILLTKRVGNVFQMIPPGWASPELGGWPKHVGLMITVVNQAEADRDIPKLLELKQRLGIPWVGLSMEPLLGPVDLSHMDINDHLSARQLGVIGGYWINALTGKNDDMGRPCPDVPKLDWIIVGGESGHNSRPMHPDWARSLRDQCVAAGVPFLFKQWGEYADHTTAHTQSKACEAKSDLVITRAGHVIGGGAKEYGGFVDEGWQGRGGAWMCKVGKSRAGRLLDGRTWDQFPEAIG